MPRGNWAHMATHALQQEKPLQWEALALDLESNPRSSQREKAPGSNEDLTKINIKKLFFLLKYFKNNVKYCIEHYVQSHMMSGCLTIGNDKFNDLIKVMTVSSLQNKG